MKRYGKDWHKRAFLLYASGWSVRRIARQPGFPSERQLRAWKGNFNCDCPFHNWDILLRQDWKQYVSEEELKRVQEEAEARERRELTPRERKILERFVDALDFDQEDIFEEINSALADVASELAAQLGIEPPRKALEITGHVQFDMLMTGYAIVYICRKALPTMMPKDPYQALNLIKLAKDIFRNWPVPTQAIPDVVTEEEVVMEIAKPELVTRPEDIEPLDSDEGSELI